MARIQVNEVTTGMLIKVTRKVQSDNSIVTIPAHTKSNSAPTRVVDIIEAGRYRIVVTDMGDVMVGRGAKITIV